jgi:hypothetical protein
MTAPAGHFHIYITCPGLIVVARSLSANGSTTFSLRLVLHLQAWHPRLRSDYYFPRCHASSEKSWYVEGKAGGRNGIQEHSLRYRWITLFFLAIYVPLVIIPWVLTCILDIRPISLPSYMNEAGQYTPGDMNVSLRWLAVWCIASRRMTISRLIGNNPINQVWYFGLCVFWKEYGKCLST